MMYVSILTSDRARDPELWAVIWRGKAPSTLRLHHVYNLAGNKRVFVWEGESAADMQFMDRFNQVGVFETYPAFDRTWGWIHAFEGNLEAFKAGLLERGTNPDRVETMVDLRARGHNAANDYAAMKEAREWVARQENVGR